MNPFSLKTCHPREGNPPEPPLEVLVCTGTAPRRVSTSSGEISVSHSKCARAPRRRVPSSSKYLHATIFVFGNELSEDCNYNYVFESLAELILEKCHSSWGKPSDYNYISEFQEEFMLQELHLQLHLLICLELKL